MRKFILSVFSILMLFSSLSYGQTVSSVQELLMPSPSKSSRRAYVIPDERNDRFCLFLCDSKVLRCQLFDTGFNLKKEILSKAQPKGYAYFHGCTIIDSIASIYFSNQKNTRYFVRKFDFRDGTSRNILFKPSSPSEAFLESVQIDNKIYLIYVVYRTSKLKIYCIKNGLQQSANEIDFADFRFNRRGDILLFDVLNDPFIDGGFVRKISKIDYDNYNTMETTAAKSKIYCMGDDIFITMDYDPANTKVIRIDGETLEGSIKVYQTPEVDSENNSNSFLFENILYQLSICKSILKISGTDIISGIRIKEYELRTSDDSVSFSNIPLMQKGGRYVKDDTYQELDIKNFMRKMNNSPIGISVFRNGDYNELLVGSYEQLNRQVSYGPPVFHYYGLLGFSYRTRINSRTVYFKALFLPDSMDHFTGPVESNPFLRIDDYLEKLDYDPLSTLIFKLNGTYYLGYYTNLTKKYFLIKF